MEREEAGILKYERIDRVIPIETAKKLLDSAVSFQHNIEMVEKVRSLVANALPEHVDFGISVHTKIAAVYSFVSDNLKYIRDPAGIELHYSPENLVRRIEAGESVMEDCDSFASLCLAMLWALGIRARLLIVGYLKPEEGKPKRYQHVFVEAWQPTITTKFNRKIGARWVIVDPSLGEQARKMNRRIKVVRIFDPFSVPPKKEKR